MSTEIAPYEGGQADMYRPQIMTPEAARDADFTRLDKEAFNKIMTDRPEIRRTRRATTASTSRMWMYPPSVYDDTIPKNQSTSNTTKIVHSMTCPPWTPAAATSRRSLVLQM